MTENSFVTLKQEVTPTIVGKPFYNDSLPKALEQAQQYAGKKGYVASMPHLLLNFPHKEWYTANSEDDVGIDVEGKFGENGQLVVLTIHGGGILSSPARIRKAYADTLTLQYAAKFTPDEFTAALRGEVAGRKRKFPVYKYKEFLEESASSSFLEDHPVYGIVRSLKDAKVQPSGNDQKIADLVNHTQVIVYAGGTQRAAEAMERASKVYKDGKLGVWHPFKVDGFDATQAQGRLLFLNSNPYNGLGGNNSLNGIGRFVGVAPEAHRVRGKRDARAEKIAQPTLEQLARSIMGELSGAVGPDLRADFEKRVRTGLQKHYR